MCRKNEDAESGSCDLSLSGIVRFEKNRKPNKFYGQESGEKNTILCVMSKYGYA